MGDESFDFREVDNGEFKLSQQMVGRSMLNMLEYIRLNY